MSGCLWEDIDPFEAALDLKNPELWTWKPLEESNYEKFISFARDGVATITDMAEELGITKGAASKLKKKGIERGELQKSTAIKLIEASK